MLLSDFLSRQKHDDTDPYYIIPILFNMQNILHTRYYNINKKEQGQYLVQTSSELKLVVLGAQYRQWMRAKYKTRKASYKASIYTPNSYFT